MMHNNVSGRNFMNAETAKFTGAVLLVTEIYALLASLVTGLEYIFAMMFICVWQAAGWQQVYPPADRYCLC